MSVYGFCFNYKNHVCKGLVIYQSSHVAYETGDCLVIDFILFESSNVQNADVVQPFAPIKPAKYEKLFCAYDAGGVSLTSRRGLFEF